MQFALPKYQVAVCEAFPNQNEASQQLCSETQRITLTALVLQQAEGENEVVPLKDHPVEKILERDTGCVFSLVPAEVLKRAVEMKQQAEEDEYFGSLEAAAAARNKQK